MKNKNREKFNSQIKYPIIFIIGTLFIFVGLMPKSTYTVKNYKLEKGYVYTGSMKGGYFHGKGTLILPNGDIYVGEFKKGRFDGKGRYNSAQEWYYEGNFKEGRLDGKGKMSLISNKIEELIFKEGNVIK